MSAQDDSKHVRPGNYDIIGQNLDDVAEMQNASGYIRSDVFRKQLDAVDLFCPDYIEARMNSAVDTCEKRMEEAVTACRMALRAYRNAHLEASKVDDRIADLRALVRGEDSA